MKIRNRFNTLFPSTKLNDINLDWLIATMKQLWTEFKEWPRTPLIRNGNWWIWNDEQEDYVDSGTAATGPQGPQGPQGVQGPRGAQGPQGDRGISISLYNTPANLPDPVLEQDGTLAVVRSDPLFGNYALYEDSGFSWDNKGKLEGPQGPQGPQGIPGEVSQAEFDALADDVDDLKSATIDDLTLNLTDRRTAYVDTIIGGQVNFNNASATYGYNKIIYVEAYKTYTIAVKQGNTVASSSQRGSVIADANDIVRNVFYVQTTAGAVNTAEITPTIDGYMILCVDKNFVDISITVKIARSVENEIRLIEGVENQNLIRLVDKTITINGVTYQVNAEQGTISTSGTSSASWSKLPFFNFVADETTTYYVAGCPAGGSNTSTGTMKYQIGLWDTTAEQAVGYDGGSGITATLTEGHYYVIFIAFGTNKSANGKVFTPILIKSSAPVSFRPHQITLNELSEESPVSILALGGKNDGTEDISKIINNNTASMAIYLPIGKYLVTSPITLTHSLLGANSIEYFSGATIPDKTATTLISGISTGDIIKTTGTSGAITISNINIVCNNDESAINVGSTARVRISNVSVYNLGNAKGIYASARMSANAYLNNVYIYAHKNKESVGIDFTGTVDCRIADTGILFCQVGAKLNGMHYLSNVHIWTGSDSSITKSWYDNTVAIYGGTSALIFGTNVYVDSAYNLLYFKTGARMWITNLMTWDDGTGASLEDTIHLTQKEGTAYLYVNGGCYNNSGRITPGTDATNQLVNFVGV